jgi:dihydrolipoamide dehydrogenase
MLLIKVRQIRLVTPAINTSIFEVSMSNDIKTQVVVLGAGPGGYSAAFRAADLGLDVVIVENRETLGGVCLNVGCIPSKALLHVAKVIDDAAAIASHGVTFGAPKIDLDKIRGWKESVVGQLTGGLSGMAKARKVTTVFGYGKFTSDKTVEVEGADGKTTITFDNAIIAAGSSVVNLPFVPTEDPRVIDSTGALELKDIPGEMLVLGGGIIGLEMGTVYRALGSKVSVVEFADQLVPAADKDIVQAYTKFNSKKFNIMLSTKVVAVDAKDDGLYVTFEGKNAPKEQVRYDKILMAVGRKPNGHLVAADKAGVNVDERGFINVTNELRTNVAHIFAIGDVIGQPMLAHKAVHEGHCAAEVISGKKHTFEPRCIPSVAYTDPEMAWAGVTEREAKEQGLNVEVSNFPWAASGRAIASARTEGKTKMIFDKETGRVLGGAIVGINAGEMLGEICLAIEMGADAEDVGLTIHAHPTLNESIGLAAEIFEGSITDLPNAKALKKKK